MELKGTVQDIIYKNETNGYTIAGFDMESAETTIVGYLPFVQKGDSLKIIGKFVTHPDYGDQFKVETFEKIMPETLDALEKYSDRQNLIQSFDNEKFYKVGFCDGVNMILDIIKKKSN